MPERILTSTPRAPQSARGVDVSVYQKVVNWPQAKAGGISFAYVKASEGIASRDPAYVRNTTGANAAGLNTGAYHFFLPTQNPVSQAQNFAAAIKGQTHTLPPAVDVETAAPGLSKSAFAAALSTMLAEVQKLTGQKPVIYTSPGFWSSYVANPQLESQYGLWQAQWGAKAPSQVGVFDTGTWQFQNAAQNVPGFSTPVDLDVMGGRTVAASLPALTKPPPPATGQAIVASGVKETTTPNKKAGQAQQSLAGGVIAAGIGAAPAAAGQAATDTSAAAQAIAGGFWKGFMTALGFPNATGADIAAVGAGIILIIIGLLWFMFKPVQDLSNKLGPENLERQRADAEKALNIGLAAATRGGVQMPQGQSQFSGRTRTRTNAALKRQKARAAKKQK
jgi:lysozyme